MDILLDSQTSKDLDSEDLKYLVKKFGEQKLVSHIINSFNDFTSEKGRGVITDLFSIDVKSFKNRRTDTDEDKSIDYFDFSIRFPTSRIENPTIINHQTRKEEPLLPIEARRNNLHYSAKLFVDVFVQINAHYNNGEVKSIEGTYKDLRLSIPILVKTKYCNISKDYTRETLLNLGEDPNDLGGYGIYKGVEWITVNTENLGYNIPCTFINTTSQQQHLVKTEIISKPGDAFENSAHLIVSLDKYHRINCRLAKQKFKNINIPFYLIFRLLGMSEDSKIIKNIIYSFDSPVATQMTQILNDAFNAKLKEFNNLQNEYDNHKIIFEIAKKLTDNDKLYYDDEAIKVYYGIVMKTFDESFLPHIGLDQHSRYKKLQYLAYLIRNLLLVHLGVIDQTDRDSYKNKRVHTPGTTYTKTFKTQFNLIVVQSIKKKIEHFLRSKPFSAIKDISELIKNSGIKPSDLEKYMIQSITSSSDVIKVGRNITKSRIQSEMLHRKNQLNTISLLRLISTSNKSIAKQNERANVMRRVQPSYIGYVCLSHSTDTGEKVGMNKQLASTATITRSKVSQLVKDKVLAQPEFIPLTDAFDPEDIYTKMLVKVFVNGDWLGFVKDGFDFVKKFINYRRTDQIHSKTSIYYDTKTDDLNIWLDIGRLTRPLLIVYNNLDELKEEAHKKKKPVDYSKFKQYIKLTKEHVDLLRLNRISFKDLRKMQIWEYICADEHENCILTTNILKLKEEESNYKVRYTHCDIPQALFGWAAMTSPYFQYNQPARVTYQTNQVRQTCGIYALNYPYRTDKDTFVQYRNEIPLVKTISLNRYNYPNGLNCMFLINCQGYNQEDSIVCNQSSADRGQFTGCKFFYEKSELEKDEEFGVPDINFTKDRKSEASYAKLQTDGKFRGLPAKGTMIEKNDIIIGKYIKLDSQSRQGAQYKDRSVIYRGLESALIEDDPIIGYDLDGNRFCKIKMRIFRTIELGDKFSARSGQKAVCGMKYNEIDMPVSVHGITPDIVFNPMSIPTRMTVNQLIEGVVAKLCALGGRIIDGTGFTSVDLDKVGELLEKFGYNRHGTEKMINGITGRYIKRELFFTPVYYQRLLKMTYDIIASSAIGPTCALTKQPVEGRRSNGAPRVGEMETTALISAGSTMTIKETFFENLDKFDHYVCRRCGRPAIVNEREQIYYCNNCKDKSDINVVPSCWAPILFRNEVETMSMNMKLNLKPYTFSSYET